MAAQFIDPISRAFSPQPDPTSGGAANPEPVPTVGGPFSEQLKAFMYAIGKQESGGRYHIKGPQTKYGRPLGKYQILDSNWAAWAREAGIPGADWRNPQAQERVAAYKFSQYYEQFNGRWDAVAVAWFAGPGRAKTFLSNPGAVANLSDVLGTSVAHYVDKAINTMNQVTGTNVLQSIPSNFVAATTGDAITSATPEQKADHTLNAFEQMFSPEFLGQTTEARSSEELLEQLPDDIEDEEDEDEDEPKQNRTSPGVRPI